MSTLTIAQACHKTRPQCYNCCCCSQETQLYITAIIISNDVVGEGHTIYSISPVPAAKASQGAQGRAGADAEHDEARLYRADEAAKNGAHKGT